MIGESALLVRYRREEGVVLGDTKTFLPASLIRFSVGLRLVANGKNNSMVATKQRPSLALPNTEMTSNSRKQRPSLAECFAIEEQSSGHCPSAPPGKSSIGNAV